MTQWSDPPGRFGGPNPIGDPASAGAPSGPPPTVPPPVAPPPMPPGPALPDAMRPGWMPQGGANPPGPNPAWPGQPGFPPTLQPPFGAAPRRSRKKLAIVLASVVLVLAGAGVFGVVRHHSSAPRTAGDTVRAYLEALARGDAAAALSFSDDQPAAKEFLTNDVLKKQIAQWPITNIRILNDDSLTGTMAMVHVAVNFGDNVADEIVDATKGAKGVWKIKQPAVKLSFKYNTTSAAALKTLTLFGTPVDTSKTTYVFPGWVDLGTSNPNISVKQPNRPFLLDQLKYEESPMLNFEISEAGHAAIDTAVKAALAQCARSTDLHPENCPQYAYDSSLVNGTAQWTLPADLSSIRISYLHADDLTADARGLVEFGLTATGSSGGKKSGQMLASVYGSVDLTKSPLVFTFR